MENHGDMDEAEVYLLTQLMELEAVANALRMLSLVTLSVDQTMQAMETAPSINREYLRSMRFAKERLVEVRVSLDHLRWELHGQLWCCTVCV